MRLVRNARTSLLLGIGLLPPGRLKRAALRYLFGWEIDESAWIGVSVFMNVKHARIGSGARIGHGNVLRNLLYLELGEGAAIGRWNWITAAQAFLDQPQAEDRGRLVVGPHAGITLRHYIDCPGGIEVGAFTTLAGVRSTILTHQIDIRSNYQITLPVKIGSYCYIGSDVRIVPGSKIPDRCVVAMGSVVAGELPESDMLYGGVPARPLKKVDEGAYFSRNTRHAWL